MTFQLCLVYFYKNAAKNVHMHHLQMWSGRDTYIPCNAFCIAMHLQLAFCLVWYDIQTHHILVLGGNEVFYMYIHMINMQPFVR